MFDYFGIIKNKIKATWKNGWSNKWGSPPSEPGADCLSAHLKQLLLVFSK